MKISQKFNYTTMKNAERNSEAPSNTGTWHKLLYVWIIASKCYDFSHCETVAGTLVAVIFGARTPETLTISRDRKLDAYNRKVAETWFV